MDDRVDYMLNRVLFENDLQSLTRVCTLVSFQPDYGNLVFNFLRDHFCKTRDPMRQARALSIMDEVMALCEGAIHPHVEDALLLDCIGPFIRHSEENVYVRFMAWKLLQAWQRLVPPDRKSTSTCCKLYDSLLPLVEIYYLNSVIINSENGDPRYVLPKKVCRESKDGNRRHVLVNTSYDRELEELQVSLNIEAATFAYTAQKHKSSRGTYQEILDDSTLNRDVWECNKRISELQKRLERAQNRKEELLILKEISSQESRLPELISKLHMPTLCLELYRSIQAEVEGVFSIAKSRLGRLAEISTNYKELVIADKFFHKVRELKMTCKEIGENRGFLQKESYSIDLPFEVVSLIQQIARTQHPQASSPSRSTFDTSNDTCSKKICFGASNDTCGENFSWIDHPPKTSLTHGASSSGSSQGARAWRLRSISKDEFIDMDIDGETK